MENTFSFSIKVPASTANLGPGFDSIGLAVNRYLTLSVKPSSDDNWTFVAMTEAVKGIPTGKENLVYQVAAAVAADYGQVLPACRVQMTSDIPLARGLGSSAAAIVAGIELANILLTLNLSMAEKARRASLFEGHPDNATASLYGGLVIGMHDETETQIVFGQTPEIDLVAVIPSYELKTQAARSLLPESMPYKEAVKASAVANVLVAAMLTNQWSLAGKMMMQDLFHQPYRMQVVPELKKSLDLASQLDVYGVSLSGAGPTVMFYVPQGQGQRIQSELSKHFPGYNIQTLQVDTLGLQVNISAE
ncbi:homoserine kinase [Fundicoccus culcitae]|uniref:Homoserine kinase n=1 Tax=Fundicoccus culcitae TaxID=2969821 RepID=A0ABY5P895_9LACT|nr:homoserine kinase [Fundicoccus culcitae]UUX34956.1 homoserine kinase [Fundicoccus culcitae]